MQRPGRPDFGGTLVRHRRPARWLALWLATALLLLQAGGLAHRIHHPDPSAHALTVVASDRSIPGPDATEADRGDLHDEAGCRLFDAVTLAAFERPVPPQLPAVVPSEAVAVTTRAEPRPATAVARARARAPPGATT